MAQVTINVETDDKQAIIELAAKRAKQVKQRVISQAQMVHVLIETYKESGNTTDAKS